MNIIWSVTVSEHFNSILPIDEEVAFTLQLFLVHYVNTLTLRAEMSEMPNVINRAYILGSLLPLLPHDILKRTCDKKYKELLVL